MSTANSPPGIGRRYACRPIHVIIRSAVTRCANTTSGGASMSIEVEKSAIAPPALPASPDFRLGGPLQPGEARRPELVEEVADRGEAVGAYHEQMAGAIALLGDETCAAKDLQMVGDDLLRDPKLQRDLPDSKWVVANPREYPASGPVRQRLQGTVDRFRLACHLTNSSTHLYKCQLVDGGAPNS